MQNSVRFLKNCILCSTLCLAPVSIAKQYIIIDGSTGARPLVSALSEIYQKQKNVVVKIGKGLKPRERVDALLAGDIDIAMASHGIDFGKLTELNLAVHPLAKTAVVIATHKSIGIANISSKQLCDIYSGRVTNWLELGSDNIRIQAFVRPLDEVDSEILSTQIKCFSNIELSSDVIVKNKSGQMARAIAKTFGGIGVTTLVRVAQNKGKIVPVSLDGIKPDTAQLLSGGYSLSRNMYLLTKAVPSAKVQAFLDFVKSEPGTNVMFKNSAVPIKAH